MIRVNIGCGRAPTPGWHNYDNSMSLRLAKHPLFTCVLDKYGMLNKEQLDFIHFILLNKIGMADASKYIPSCGSYDDPGSGGLQSLRDGRY